MYAAARLDYDYSWPPGFPKGYGHTSISYLKSRNGYADAKNGDHKAAESVVRGCIKRNRAEYIRKLYPNAILLPILGVNKLPLALANAIGLPVLMIVYIVQPIKRKELPAMRRLLIKPQFYICTLPPNDYIIVDDVITQGGTVAALRQYILKLGGRVVAVLALAYAIGSQSIAPTENTLEKIKNKFDQVELSAFLNEFNISSCVEELTNSQCRYLLRFLNVANINKKASAVITELPTRKTASNGLSRLRLFNV